MQEPRIGFAERHIPDASKWLYETAWDVMLFSGIFKWIHEEGEAVIGVRGRYERESIQELSRASKCIVFVNFLGVPIMGWIMLL